MPNLVMWLGAKDVDKALRPLHTLRVEATAVGGLFAMTNKVDGGVSRGQCQKTEEEESV